MDIVQAVKERRSIRGFKPDPVPKEVLKQLLETCRWSPSAQNTQSWEFYVLGGKVMEEVKARLTEKVIAKIPAHPEIPTINLIEPYLKRSIEQRDSVDAQQFPPGTKDLEQKRADYNISGGRFHNAPNGIIICTEKNLAPRLIIDIGIVAQTIALTAQAMGLGVCIMARPTYYPEILRDLLKIPESKLIVIGIAIGYPDPRSLVNSYPRRRVEVDDLVHWYGF